MSPMWQATAVALPPAALIAAATASQPSCLRLETITCAPYSAYAFAIASPMPRLAPVTTATLPDRSNEIVICVSLPRPPYRPSRAAHASSGLFVLGHHSRHHFAGRQDVVDVADALAGAPDVAPGFLFHVAAATEIHLRLVGFRQVIGVETGQRHAVPEVIAFHAREERRVDDVVRAGRDDHVLVALIDVGLRRREETRADVRHVRTERQRGKDVRA